MSQKKGRIGICVYCGKETNLTKDHIPPKQFFSKPRPNNLITIPSCFDCNSGASKDDEYFRMMLLLSIDAYGHPEVYKLLPQILRSLNKPEKAGFSRAFYKTLQAVELRTKSGLYLGNAGKYTVDENRLNKVLERIVLGLFFHEKGYRLPKSHTLDIYSGWQLKQSLPDAPDEIKSCFQQVYQIIDTVTPKIIGNDVFSYKVSFPSSQDQNFSIWWITFFKEIIYLGTTRPKDSENLNY